jgi:predicted small lipoprotein YifL
MKNVALMFVVAVVVAACGQKGPLYLPDEGGEVVTRPGGQQQRQPPSPETAPQPSTTRPDEEKESTPR